MLYNNSTLNNVSTKLFFVYWTAIVVLCIFRSDVYGILSYQSFEISDWLINYEGGFVRRGLDGQLLHWIYQVLPFAPVYMVKCLVVTESVFFLVLLLHVFRKEGWSLAILPFGCCMFFLFLQTGQRRDMFMLMGVFVIFLCYKRYLTFGTIRGGKLYLLLLSFMSLVVILSHEATFFFCFPIMMVYGFITMRKEKSQTHNYLNTLVIPFLPSIITMVLVCLFKGNETTANVIWQSWSDAFKNYPDGLNDYKHTISNIGYGVGALTWSTMSTVKFHLSLNLFHGTPIKMLTAQDYAVFPLLIWLIMATFYMVSHINCIKVAAYKLTDKPQTSRIMSVLLLQLVFMLPMLSVLSCDYGRTIPYWVFSSLFALHIFGDLDWHPLNEIVIKMSRVMDSSFFNSATFFLIVALLIPFDQAWGPMLNEILPFRVFGL